MPIKKSKKPLLLIAALGLSAAAWAADDAELDALKLDGEPAKSTTAAAATPTKLFVEGAWGRASLRGDGGSQAIGRLSLDLRHGAKLSPAWRAVLSNRLDHVHPVAAGNDQTVNTLREAYLGWQNEAAEWDLELGRINLRNGPAYGYNPTDFFRDGSQRVLTTVDPIALRENRMGTVGLRVQRLWQSGAMAATLAPELTNSTPSRNGASLDLGATNRSNRLLLSASQQLPGGVSGQLLLFKAQNQSAQLGLNATALLGDAWVAHGEWSGGREPDLAARAFGGSGTRRADRWSAGLTASPGGGWSMTTEVQHNGFALSESQWRALAASGGAPALGRYLLAADQRQDLAARRALLVYVSKKGLGLKNLDLTALLRSNLDDHSRLAWIELRHVWPSFELALQWQHFGGGSNTEFGVLPFRSSVQLLGTYRF